MIVSEQVYRAFVKAIKEGDQIVSPCRCKLSWSCGFLAQIDGDADPDILGPSSREAYLPDWCRSVGDRCGAKKLLEECGIPIANNWGGE